MKQAWKRWLASALAAVMLLSLLPLTEWGTAFAVGTYGRITGKSVAFRKGPSTDYDIWFRLTNGVIATVLDQVPVNNGKIWYKIILQKPGSNSGNTYIGYVHSDYFALLTEQEAIAWEANPVNAVPETSSVKPGGAVGTITNGGVNLRAEPSMKGAVLLVLERGTVVDVLTVPAASDPDPWYQVEYLGVNGYVKGEFLRLTSGGSATPVPGVVTPQPPVANVTPTPAPAAPTGDTYVRLLLSSAPLYASPNGDQRTTWTGTGSTLPLAGMPVMMAGFSWYPVSYMGAIYYVRGDYIQQTATQGQAAASTATPAPGASLPPAPALPAVGYIKTIKGDVNLRLQPSGEVVQSVARNVVLPYLSAPVNQDGYDWYYVQVGNVRGYLRGDCVTLCTADGTPLTVQPVVTAVPSAGATEVPSSAFNYVRTTMNNVNLRDLPAGKTIEQIKNHVVLRLNGKPVTSGMYTWYPVLSKSGRTGYLRSDCVELCNADGTTIPATPTPVPVTAAPADATPTPGPTVVFGYVRTTKTSVNVRKTPAGDSIGTVKKGTVWPMFSTAVTQSGYTWYPVTVNGQKGYLRGDCVTQLTDEQVIAYLAGEGIPTVTASPTPTPAPETVTVNYVQTTVDYVNLRKAASKDSQSVTKVRTGTVMAFSNVSTVGGSKWYNIVYKGEKLWVLGSCVKVMTQAEYEIYAATHPGVTIEPAASVGGYVRTTKGGVNVRKTAGGSVVLGQVARNQVFAYTATANANKYEWYKVTTNYGTGWIRGDCVTECQSDGQDLPKPVITPSPTAGPGGSGGSVIIPSTGTEASYKILKLGSSGSNVTRLVQELIRQGYFTGKVTSSYTTEVEAAVRAFQAAKGLNVDGIAGASTQHALFGTVPVGTVDGSDMSMVIYPAEKIDWFKGGIQEMIPRGTNFKIYDVRTGYVWWAHRWAGGNHADIEPLTSADTARLCAIYGVSKPSEIVSKNMWQRRPCLITVGNRTFACSLYGVPHNYGAGDITNNNFNGQVCLHFTNSKTHSSKKVDSYHAAAIQFAWENAPNGHK